MDQLSRKPGLTWKTDVGYLVAFVIALAAAYPMLPFFSRKLTEVYAWFAGFWQ